MRRFSANARKRVSVGASAIRGAADSSVTSEIQLNHEGIIEIGVFVDAVPGIAPRVADHAGIAHPIIKTAMGVAMQPQRRLPVFDPRLEVRDKT
ncbi:hypothetical protein D3C76_1642890 [compost metagenome]